MQNAETENVPAPRERLSFEMILRRSFWDSFKDYIRNCSLVGAKQMCDSSLALWQRFIWTIVFCVSFGTVCYFLKYVWTDTLTKPLIVTLESTEYPIDDIDFPAVAICNTNRISKKAIEKLAADEFEDLALSNKHTVEEVQQVLLNLGRLMDYSYNESLKNNQIYRKFIEKYRLNTEIITQIMKTLAPSCDEMILMCAWAGNIVDCNKLFTMRRTANRGFCCTFNYVLNYNLLPKSVAPDPIIKRQTDPGFLQGLNVVLDPLLDDYAYPICNYNGFDILIFDAMHFADPSAGRVNHRMLEPNSFIFLEIKSTKQVASKEIRRYSVDTRKCLFNDEMRDVYEDTYSYSTCIVVCRVMTIESLCKCTPFFFATAGRVRKPPVCTLEDLKCLNKYKEKLYNLYPYGTQNTQGLEMELEDSLNCPECLPDCEITQYSTKSFEAPLMTNQKEKTLKDLFFGDIDMVNKSVLSIYHPTRDAILVRLDVVFYWYEILSNIGGFSGVIVGFSFISVMEIIYFFTIRYVQHFCENYKKYYW